MAQNPHQHLGGPGDGDRVIGRWTDPDSGAVFTIGSDLIQQLRAYVFEGFHIVPKRGAEMGGLLLGRILSTEPLALEVTGFEPVTCEYRYGPSYILSDADRARLSLALGRFNAPSRTGPSSSIATVIGYFRSCTGRDLALDAADQQLMRNFFPDSSQIVLSIHPSSPMECEAWFFHRHDGVLPRLPAHPPQPFGVYQPPTRLERPQPEVQHTAQPALAEGLASLQQAVAPPPEPDPPPRDEPITKVRQVEEPDAGGDTSTDHRPFDGSFDSLEARRLVERRRSLRGGRRFDDVPYEPEEEEEQPSSPPEPQWTLSEAPLRASPYPLWQLVLVLLLLLGIAGFGYQWWDAQQRARWARLGLDAVPGPSGVEVTWDRQSPALLGASRGVLDIIDASASKPGVTRQMELDAQALSQGRLYYPSAGGDVLFRLHLYSSGLAGAVESVRVVGKARGRGTIPAALTASAPPPPEVPAAAPAKPAPAPEAAPPVQSAVLAATPAEVIHETQPEVPEGVRARITEPITIPVLVEIDERGHVTRAAAQGDGDGVYRYLAAKAAIAAQSWVFRPAKTAAGVATTAHQTIYFTFRG